MDPRNTREWVANTPYLVSYIDQRIVIHHTWGVMRFDAQATDKPSLKEIGTRLERLRSN